jgi:hypothetical protein
MNRMQQARAERQLTIFGRLRRFGLFKIVGLMLLLGVLMGIAFVHLIPFFMRLGVPPRVADKLPYFGMAGGLLVGFSAPLSREVMVTLQIGMALPMLAFAVIGTALSMVAGLVWAIELLALLPVIAGLTVVLVLIILVMDRLPALFGSKPG